MTKNRRILQVRSEVQTQEAEDDLREETRKWQSSALLDDEHSEESYGYDYRTMMRKVAMAVRSLLNAMITHRNV